MLVPSAFNQSMSAFVAQNMGAGKAERAKKALFTGVGLSLAVGVFMAWLAFFHGDLLAGLFARDAAVIAAAAEYLKAYAIDCLLVSIMFLSLIHISRKIWKHFRKTGVCPVMGATRPGRI